ncbi:MAG: hypothetical protein BGO77_02625 [Caedibacter sp. 37-49]|nr:MAG: hypothetical protein BGO77_02625 [Caedibacter sp. 37-49]
MNRTCYKKRSQNTWCLIFLVSLILIFLSWNSRASNHKLELDETPADFYTSGKCPCSTGPIQYNYDLPNEHSLRMTPIKDQGPLGTCVSFASSAIAEYHYGSRFSEAEFTVLAQTNKLGNKCEGGLFLGNALRVARQYGFVKEDVFGYSQYVRNVAIKNGININRLGWQDQLREQDDAKICNLNDYNGTMREFGIDLTLTGNPASDFTDYRLSNLRVIHHSSKGAQAQALYRQSRIGVRELERRLGNLSVSSSTLSKQTSASIGKPLEADIESVEKALCCGSPVVAALDVYENCWDGLTTRNGYQISMPQRGAKIDGSHAIVIKGFDYNRELFEIKNSWGTNWGNQGYAYLPYEYVKLYSTELVAVGRQ